jgi:hypothetical protein
MGNSVYLISTKAHGGCDRSAEDAYSSVDPDPTFAFVGGPYYLTLDFVFALLIIMFYTLLTSLLCISKWSLYDMLFLVYIKTVLFKSYMYKFKNLHYIYDGYPEI